MSILERARGVKHYREFFSFPPAQSSSLYLVWIDMAKEFVEVAGIGLSCVFRSEGKQAFADRIVA